jgi:hypothetical protein
MDRPTRPVEKTGAARHDFSFAKTVPEFAAAVIAQVERDEASDDFVKEKLHPNFPPENLESPTPASPSAEA